MSTTKEIACSGFLYKKPEKNSLMWKKRYCVLLNDQIVLSYYENEDKFKQQLMKGKIPFSSVHNWDGKPHGFQFYTPAGKCYRVYCDTAEQRQQWLSAMQAQLDKAPETKDGEKYHYIRPIETQHSFISDVLPPIATTTPKDHHKVVRCDSWRGEDVDLPSMYEELEDLRSEVTSLRAEVIAYSKMEDKIMRERRHSILDDGTTVNLEPVEMEKMRYIFSLFDTQNSGFISADALKQLHVKLGEPISDEDAQEAMEFMNNKEDGKVDFDSFIKWWNEDHKAGDHTAAMLRYQAKFKFLKARIANPAIGRITTEVKENAAFPSFEFRLNFFYEGDDGKKIQISPWHDIPLYNSNGSVNFICEIPKWTRKKMEIATGEEYNPIKQDTKNGKLREYTWGDMMFNYGALPQTWEDPEHQTEGTGCIGDNDPLDVVEIGTKQWRTGAIVQVKVLGVLALIDDGETDWKLICINIEDHFAPLINDVADVEAHMPGCINAIHDWLRDYKLPKINRFGYEGKCMNRDFAEAVVTETHEFWKQLIEERGELATV